MEAEADKPHILVVDDDTRLRELLKSFLSRNGFRVTAASSASEARQRLQGLDFDLIVLDVMMPGQTGLEFAGELRRTDDVPILMLTAMGDPKDRIAGLEKGVDDYLGKPFEPRELLARVRALLRRTSAHPEDTDVWRFGRLEIDAGLRQVRLGGVPCDLTSYQFDLLSVMAQHPGRVLSRDQLLDQVWGDRALVEERTVDVHIGRLRKALGATDDNDPIRTVRSAGYSLDLDG